MKILYIADSSIPSKTANSIQVMKMCQAFAGCSNIVRLLIPYAHLGQRIEKKVNDVYSYYSVNKIFSVSRVLWPWFDKRGIIFGFLCGIMARFIRTDIVYSRSLYGSWFASIFGLKVVFEMHASVKDGRGLAKFIFGLLSQSKNLIGVVVISNALKKIVQNRLKKKKILVCHDGADLIRSQTSFLEEIRTKYQLNEKTNVGYIGHLYPGKGVENIILIARELKDLKFNVFGGYDSEINRLKKISGHNVYFHGYVPYFEVGNIIQSFDILLLPAQKIVTPYGGKGNISEFMSPLKLFEYMAAGKSIIASNLPVLREVLTDGHNALLVGPDSIDEWKCAIRKLIRDSALRCRLGEQAKSDFERKYTWEKRAQKIVAFINNVNGDYI